MAHCQLMYRTEPAINWIRLPVSQTEHQPQVYNVSFLRSTKICPCHPPGCPGSSLMWNGLRLQFRSHHWGDRVKILEEHPNPLPKCKRCGSQLPAGRLNNLHYASEKCKQEQERRLICKTLQQFFESGRVLFHINAEALSPSEAVPYLGRIIVFNKSYWAAVYQNLRKYQNRWGMVARVMERTGAMVESQGAVYKVVAHLVLLYGS